MGGVSAYPPKSRSMAARASLERDVQQSRLLPQRVAAEALQGVAERGAGPEVELPHVLEAGQDRPVVHTLLQRDGLVRAQRLEGHVGGAGVDDEDVDAPDRELLHAV